MRLRAGCAVLVLVTVIVLASACGSHARAVDATRVSADSPFAECATKPAFDNAEVEPSLAVDPREPRRLVAAWQQDRYERGGGARGAVVALSSDGGQSWKQSALPVTACAGPGARQAPFASDPWVSVGLDGRIYAAALSDAAAVVTSTDWGGTWSKPATVRGPGLTDKESITADPHRAGPPTSSGRTTGTRIRPAPRPTSCSR